MLKGSIKQTWQLIDDIIKRKKKKVLNITEFKQNNESVTDTKQIVNGFNDYFANIGSDLAKKINVDTNLTFKHYLKVARGYLLEQRHPLLNRILGK